jgi:hypothetical protein
MVRSRDNLEEMVTLLSAPLYGTKYRILLLASVVAKSM